MVCSAVYNAVCEACVSLQVVDYIRLRVSEIYTHFGLF